MVGSMSTRFFSEFSKRVAKKAGTSAIFFVAVGIVLLWIITGPLFHFSDTWQLVINTGTTIITFLMVFIIQNTQNRDTEALQLKIDELLRISTGHNALLDIEELTEEELDLIKSEYARLASTARESLRCGKKDTH